MSKMTSLNPLSLTKVSGWKTLAMVGLLLNNFLTSEDESIKEHNRIQYLKGLNKIYNNLQNFWRGG